MDVAADSLRPGRSAADLHPGPDRLLGRPPALDLDERAGPQRDGRAGALRDGDAVGVHVRHGPVDLDDARPEVEVRAPHLHEEIALALLPPPLQRHAEALARAEAA